ncbi:cellulose synthase A catalytic subunit 3 [UDP-forming]-like isoform X1 [Carya illinoinensis]|uniref:cellulose synthase A catalytic subunit 3 [UDP-forming]-like isoform X1 n=2 Tax=Carya illinoinensis TaxID=32201 RepID=UPI001C719DDE|nr:cellulose synthase A catalytic subunit 3 [UDP-forming]-like isoform X1 [Carya illinoinensis]
MESEGETGAKATKNLGGHVCQIYGDNVGKSIDGEPFIACHVCAFPICRPCYEYERKDGNQSCPQCKTQYKRHKGSPAILGDREEDADTDDGASDFNYTS